MQLSSITGGSSLYKRLMAIRPHIAAAAQEVYDLWEQDEFDSGGICDEISSAINTVINSAGIDATEGGHDGDDHSYMVAYDNITAFIVDIPYDTYEIGGGYSWEKIPDVVFTPDDIIIAPTQRPDWV
jgi:hypothetical protein